MFWDGNGSGSLENYWKYVMLKLYEQQLFLLQQVIPDVFHVGQIHCIIYKNQW